MAAFNRVILAGHLTRDPELRYTPKGKPVAVFGLGVNRVWTTEAGEKKEEVTFVDVEAFGKTGEVIAKYLKKGRPALLEGRLKMDAWADKATGEKKSKLKVVLESFSFLDYKAESAAPPPESSPTSAPDSPPADSDDVPF